MTDSQSVLASFDDESREFLNKFRFDSQTFTKLRTELEKGEFTKARNFIQAELEPNKPEDIMPWPEPGSEAEQVGQAAIDAGQVGAVILNGGMATRFGGVVKGVVEALPGHSFLNLKLKDVGRFGEKVTSFMNSLPPSKTPWPICRTTQ